MVYKLWQGLVILVSASRDEEQNFNIALRSMAIIRLLSWGSGDQPLVSRTAPTYAG